MLKEWESVTPRFARADSYMNVRSNSWNYMSPCSILDCGDLPVFERGGRDEA